MLAPMHGRVDVRPKGKIMNLRDQAALADFATHIGELHKLVAAGLVIVDSGAPDGYRFPQPDHPRVVAWRAHAVPDDDMRDRAWLLHEAGQMYAEAKADNRSPEAIERAMQFARSVADMPMVTVREHLAHFVRGKTAGQA